MGALVTLTLVLAATLEGTVQLPNGAPAGSVLVAAIPHDGGWWSVGGVARTDRQGRFRIADLAPGEYALTAAASRSGAVFLDRATGRAVLRLQRGRTLEGSVTHANGDPLHGRLLARRLSDHARDLFVIETDARGRFTASLPPARYRLFAEGADGKVEKSVDLRDGNSAIALRLERVFHVTPPAVVNWIRREAVPLGEDLSPLRRIIGDARIVALGEATHGSHEFVELKQRIVRYLAEEMGFSVMAMEMDAQDETPQSIKVHGIDMQDPDAIRARSLPSEWKERLIRQGEQLLRVTARANEVRDRFMAENVEWILDRERPGTKIIVSAHNGHVAAEGPQLLGGESMGYHLRQRFGDQMRIIGFAFDRGRFRAGAGEYEADAAKPASLDAALAMAGHPLFVIDLRSARGVVRRWLDSPVEHRSIGTTYNPAVPGNAWSVIHPGRSYDAILFVRETTAARARR